MPGFSPRIFTATELIEALPLYEWVTIRLTRNDCLREVKIQRYGISGGWAITGVVHDLDMAYGFVDLMMPDGEIVGLPMEWVESVV